MADIFRMIKNNNYTVMSNHHLQNPRLSLKAMGLMSKILSLPDDWKYSVKGLAAYCKDGYESVRTALCELEAEGYLVRRKIRNERGQIANTEYIFRESPDMVIPGLTSSSKEGVQEKEESPESRINTGNSPESGNPILDKKTEKTKKKSADEVEYPTSPKSPESDFPITENPSLENRHQQNTNKQNTIKQNIYNISSSSSSTLSGEVIHNQEKQTYREKEKREEEEIKRRIRYEELLDKYQDKGLLDEIVSLLGDFCASEEGYGCTIGGRSISAEQMKLCFSQVEYAQVASILSAIREKPRIKNLQKYLLTSLYRSVVTTRENEKRRQEQDEEEEIKRRIRYEELVDKYPDDKLLLDEIVGLLGDFCASRPGYGCMIGGRSISAEQMKQRLAQVESVQISSILSAMQEAPPIGNLQKYLLTALYQSVVRKKQGNENRGAHNSGKNRFNNFHQREYDFGDLEKQLLQAQKETSGV